ncbi:hypothetical protein D9M71_61170 [compost metagenome]|uniref:hypothetical protein n=1 Tax=unclassified Pseudomonas TaxID=196821 RepID=UPI000FAF5183|nr:MULTISPECIES: hypothetical protein [unclassified Pseudomonas]PBJ05327.1 hypothetical protein BSF40_33220 [Pseudomonas sp. ACN5]
MVVNDDAVSLKPHVVLEFIASKLAPTEVGVGAKAPFIQMNGAFARKKMLLDNPTA